jgi:hypothetical protein
VFFSAERIFGKPSPSLFLSLQMPVHNASSVAPRILSCGGRHSHCRNKSENSRIVCRTAACSSSSSFLCFELLQ